MNVTIEDRATPEVRAYIARLSDRTQLHDEMGMAVERQVVKHLRTVKVPQGNRLGAPSTGFWKSAIDSVVGTADAQAATVSIPARGVALQYYGGAVRAKTKPFLTIPIHAAAHGKSVEELGVRVYRFLSKKGNLILATDPAPPRSGSSGRERKPRTGPPFDFGSGMGVRDVARDQAEALGLIAPGQRPRSAEVGFNDALQASVRGLDERVVRAMERNFNEGRTVPQVKIENGIISWIKQPGHQLSLLFDAESASGSAASVEALKEGLADLSRVVRLPDGPVIPMRETARMHDPKAEGEYWPAQSGEHGIRVLAPKLPSGKLAQAHEVGHFLDELLGGGKGYASAKSTDADVVGVMQAIHDSPLRSKALAADAASGQDYWSKDSELFARAFAQWAAEKSGDDLQIRLLERRAKRAPHAAWTRQDFKPVAEAMDYLFAKRRLRS